MLALICLVAAVVCWTLGAFNVTRPAINWTCAGLVFAGAGLWIAPLIHA
jgi:hypothetical protein